MNILFIHGNYPAQFRSLAIDLGKQKLHDIRYLTAKSDPETFPIKGVKVEKYEDNINKDGGSISQMTSILDEQVKRGIIIQNRISDLISSGFTPRIVFFHGGNGLGLFLRQILPNTCFIGYFEWYFSRRCASYILNQNNLETHNFVSTRNIGTESEILHCDACVVPTKWQASQFPAKLRPYLSVIFDGVDTEFFKKGDGKLRRETICIEGENDKIEVEAHHKLITYATRGMEPLRGFPQFMKALPGIIKKTPNIKILIGGRDRSAYGPECPKYGGSWKQMMLEEIPTLKDNQNIVFTGLMNYVEYRKMLQRTDLHFYFTKPYVTSWSLFEALACQAPIITNRCHSTNGTLPIKENSIIEKIEDIHSTKGIEKAVRLIQEGEDNDYWCLPEEFSLEYSRKSWESLINNALGQKKH